MLCESEVKVFISIRNRKQKEGTTAIIAYINEPSYSWQHYFYFLTFQNNVGICMHRIRFTHVFPLIHLLLLLLFNFLSVAAIFIFSLPFVFVLVVLVLGLGSSNIVCCRSKVTYKRSESFFISGEIFSTASYHKFSISSFNTF